jgi:hypothetical protein
MSGLEVSISHRLPGRLRLRLSHALTNPDAATRHVMEHAGLVSVTYTPVTRSVLIHHGTGEVTAEEIVLRVALALSLDHGALPVRVFSQDNHGPLSGSAVASGALLGAALVSRFFGGSDGKVPPWMDTVAGLGTLWAGLDHGWMEIRERGAYDPEVASLFLLVVGMIRGSALPAALLTWFGTFGRHLVEQPRSAIEVRPVEMGRGPSGPRYEVDITPVAAEARGVPLLRTVPSLLWFAVTGTRGGLETGLIDEMRQVARLHHKVVEGLGPIDGGIPLHVR